MPSGYVSRWKGKVQAVRIDLGSGGINVFSTVTLSTVNITPTALASLYGGGAAGLTATTGSSASGISAAGISILPPTTFNSTYYLADPLPGVTKTFVSLTTVASSGTRSVASLTTGTIIVGTTIGNADTLNFGSTGTQMTVEMMGISTTKWAILGMSPVNTSTVAASTQLGPTLSTRS